MNQIDINKNIITKINEGIRNPVFKTSRNVINLTIRDAMRDGTMLMFNPLISIVTRPIGETLRNETSI